MGKSFLVVDDTAFMRGMIKNTLEESGYFVISEATDGQDAIDKYKQFSPDFVTMDITMPNMDGIKAVEHIMDYDDDANIIMISAAGQKSFVLSALRAGAKHFILKPVTPAKLLKAIEEVEAFNE